MTIKDDFKTPDRTHAALSDRCHSEANHHPSNEALNSFDEQVKATAMDKEARIGQQC